MINHEAKIQYLYDRADHLYVLSVATRFGLMDFMKTASDSLKIIDEWYKFGKYERSIKRDRRVELLLDRGRRMRSGFKN